MFGNLRNRVWSGAYNGNIIGDVSPLAQLDNLQYLHLDSRNIESGNWLKKHLPNCEIYFLELPDEIPF